MTYLDMSESKSNVRWLLWPTILVLNLTLPISSATDEMTTITIQQTTRLPIDLYDIGYYGTWEKFCDPLEIQQDFPGYPEHDLKKIRLLICSLRKDNKIDRSSMPAFAAYKYCHTIKTVADDFFEKLTFRFSDYDDAKKGELLAGEKNLDANCYNVSMDVFNEKCMGPMHPCNRMFKQLISHACVMNWLTTQDIGKHIDEVCNGKWLTDKVDWDPIFLTIKYSE